LDGPEASSERCLSGYIIMRQLHAGSELVTCRRTELMLRKLRRRLAQARREGEFRRCQPSGRCDPPSLNTCPAAIIANLRKAHMRERLVLETAGGGISGRYVS
jgi:hypothetical protein